MMSYDAIICGHCESIIKVSLLVDVLQFKFLTSYYNIASLNS